MGQPELARRWPRIAAVGAHDPEAIGLEMMERQLGPWLATSRTKLSEHSGQPRLDFDVGHCGGPSALELTERTQQQERLVRCPFAVSLPLSDLGDPLEPTVAFFGAHAEIVGRDLTVDGLPRRSRAPQSRIRDSRTRNRRIQVALRSRRPM
jgi:hypothetical protein